MANKTEANTSPSPANSEPRQLNTNLGHSTETFKAVRQQRGILAMLLLYIKVFDRPRTTPKSTIAPNLSDLGSSIVERELDYSNYTRTQQIDSQLHTIYQHYYLERRLFL